MSMDTPRRRQIDRELERQERYPWLLLTRCFSAAIGPQILALAAIGAIATTAGWRLADQLFLKPALKIERAQLDYDSQFFSKWPGERDNSAHPLRKSLARLEPQFGSPPDDPFFALPYRIVGPVIGFAGRESTSRSMAYYFLGGLWTVLVWAGFGGAITRMAALRFTRDDIIDVSEGLHFAQQKLLSFVGGICGPLLGVVVLSLPVMLLGLLMRTGFGAAVSGLAWLLVLPFGLAISIILLGLLFGWPLVWGSIATESSDAFDAVSRSYSYALQRPLQYLGYTLYAAVLGTLGWLVVWFVSETMVHAGLWAAGTAAGHDRVDEILAAAATEKATGSLAFGGKMIGFWNGLLRTFASAYAYSFFWCATAAVYLLLRKSVDGAELDQIALESEQEYGLPRLATDEEANPSIS